MRPRAPTARTARSGCRRRPRRRGPTSAFNEYDADNNGQIDCAELGAALKKAGKEFTPEQVEAALAKHDKDKDGKLSWGEFQAIFQSDE